MAHALITKLQPGMIRPSLPKKGSQAHHGVSPLHPVSHRNVSFQPLPRSLGLAPYHYDLAQTFPDIDKAIHADGQMVLHVVGDSGGVQDGEFQMNVAEQMVADLQSGKKPHFCYHVGDVVYFTGSHDDYYASSMSPTRTTTRRFSPSPATTMARWTIPRRRHRLTAGSTISCRKRPM